MLSHISIIAKNFLKDHDYPISEIFWYSPKKEIPETIVNCFVI